MFSQLTCSVQLKTYQETSQSYTADHEKKTQNKNYTWIFKLIFAMVQNFVLNEVWIMTANTLICPCNALQTVNLNFIWASAWDFKQCDTCDQQSLRSTCAYAQSDQSICLSLEYSIIVKLLTEHHLEFLSFKGSYTGSSQSTLVKMPHCWKSHVTAHFWNKLSFKIIIEHGQGKTNKMLHVPSAFRKVRHNSRVESWLGCM